MKIQIRKHCFETNSSSVHSLTMCMADDYNKGIDGKVLMKDGNFLDVDKAILENVEDLRKYESGVTEEDIKSYLNGDVSLLDLIDKYNLSEYGITPEEDDITHEYYETFEQSFVTPTGEKIIAYGYYGNDY